MKEDQSSYCGKDGRRARAYLRSVMDSDFYLRSNVSDGNFPSALDHLESCSNCHRKMDAPSLSALSDNLYKARKILAKHLATDVSSSDVIDVSPPTRDIVSASIDRDLGNLELDFSNLSHLEKVVSLVYLLLNAEEHFIEDAARQRLDVAYKDFEDVRERKRQAGEGERVGWDDLIRYSKDFLHTWIATDKTQREELPEIVTQKIIEKNNPFDLDPDVVRAILEMANDFYEKQLENDGIKIGSYDPEWRPVPTEYLVNVLEEMFFYGKMSGINPFSRTKFPAAYYYREIFTEEVSVQMRKLLIERGLAFRKLTEGSRKIIMKSKQSGKI